MFNPVLFYESGKRRLKPTLNMPLASNLLDISGNGLNASAVGTETHSLGGLVTNTGQYAFIPNSTLLDFGTGSLSFGCKVKFNSIIGLNKGIIGKSIGGNTNGRYAIYLDSSQIGCIIRFGAVNYTVSTSAIGYDDGNFHNIFCTIDRTLGTFNLFIDDVLLNSVSIAVSSVDTFVNRSFIIGAYGNAAGTGILASSELNGIIKNVFLFRRVITINESKIFLNQ